MKHPTSEEIWGEGDWWQRRKNKQKINKHLGRHGHYLPGTNRSSKHDENIEKIFGIQTVSDGSRTGLWVLGGYILGILLVRVIYDSWFLGLLWPIIAPFWILAKLI